MNLQEQIIRIHQMMGVIIENKKDEKSKDSIDKKEIIQMFSFSDFNSEHNNGIIFDYVKSEFIDEFVNKNFEDSEKEFKKEEYSNKKFKYEDLDKETKKKWNIFINSYRTKITH